MAVRTRLGALAEGLGTHRKSRSGQEDCPQSAQGVLQRLWGESRPGRVRASRAGVRMGRAGELDSRWLLS